MAPTRGRATVTARRRSITRRRLGDPSWCGCWGRNRRNKRQEIRRGRGEHLASMIWLPAVSHFRLGGVAGEWAYTRPIQETQLCIGRVRWVRSYGGAGMTGREGQTPNESGEEVTVAANDERQGRISLWISL